MPTRNDGPLPAEDVDLVQALVEPRFVGGVPDVGFGGTDRERRFGDVESTPHNYVHVDIAGLMESPATAGQDPIFWLHHANIDRLWEVWLALPGSVRLTDPGGGSALLVSQWQSAIFWFGLEQSPSTYTMDDVEDLSSATMGYEYESIELPEASAAAIAAARELVPVGGGGLPLDEAEPGGSRWRRASTWTPTRSARSPSTPAARAGRRAADPAGAGVRRGARGAAARGVRRRGAVGAGRGAAPSRTVRDLRAGRDAAGGGAQLPGRRHRHPARPAGGGMDRRAAVGEARARAGTARLGRRGPGDPRPAGHRLRADAMSLPQAAPLAGRLSEPVRSDATRLVLGVSAAAWRGSALPPGGEADGGMAGRTLTTMASRCRATPRSSTRGAWAGSAPGC